jgi:hypothetical protein
VSCRIRWEQSCAALDSGVRCTRPATELGHLCTAHWQGLSPTTRATLQWEAAWAIEIPEPTGRSATAMLSDWDIVRAAESMLADGAPS